MNVRERSQIGYEKEIVKQLNCARFMCAFEDRLSINLFMVLLMFRWSDVSMGFLHGVLRPLQ